MRRRTLRRPPSTRRTLDRRSALSTGSWRRRTHRSSRRIRADHRSDAGLQENERRGRSGHARSQNSIPRLVLRRRSEPSTNPRLALLPRSPAEAEIRPISEGVGVGKGPSRNERERLCDGKPERRREQRRRATSDRERTAPSSAIRRAKNNGFRRAVPLRKSLAAHAAGERSSDVHR